MGAALSADVDAPTELGYCGRIQPEPSTQAVDAMSNSINASNVVAETTLQQGGASRHSI